MQGYFRLSTCTESQSYLGLSSLTQDFEWDSHQDLSPKSTLHSSQHVVKTSPFTVLQGVRPRLSSFGSQIQQLSQFYYLIWELRGQHQVLSEKFLHLIVRYFIKKNTSKTDTSPTTDCGGFLPKTQVICPWQPQLYKLLQYKAKTEAVKSNNQIHLPQQHSFQFHSYVKPHLYCGLMLPFIIPLPPSKQSLSPAQLPGSEYRPCKSHYGNVISSTHIFTIAKSHRDQTHLWS